LDRILKKPFSRLVIRTGSDSKKLGMDYYKPRSKNRENWYQNNMRWIRDKIKEGREFFTKGRDPKRIPNPQRTDYYGGELNELRMANCPVKEVL
jgi:hypothetical protein